jgi:hypothetical protein
MAQANMLIPHGKTPNNGGDLMTELVKTTKRKATTKAGKGVRALNSLRHGIQAKSVLPSEQAEYALHQNALHASLEPQGYCS